MHLRNIIQESLDSTLNLVQCYELGMALVRDTIGEIYKTIVLIENHCPFQEENLGE